MGAGLDRFHCSYSIVQLWLSLYSDHVHIWTCIACIKRCWIEESAGLTNLLAMYCAHWVHVFTDWIGGLILGYQLLDWRVMSACVPSSHRIRVLDAVLLSWTSSSGQRQIMVHHPKPAAHSSILPLVTPKLGESVEWTTLGTQLTLVPVRSRAPLPDRHPSSSSMLLLTVAAPTLLDRPSMSRFANDISILYYIFTRVLCNIASHMRYNERSNM